MTKNEGELKAAVALASYLGKPVRVPPENKIMRLVEIYSSGNVACIPIGMMDRYSEALREFHASSVSPLKTKENPK